MGAAMFAATVAGIYNKVEDAMLAMGQGFEKTYYPQAEMTEIYRERYEKYIRLGHFVEYEI
jgi:L-ribulokinase